MKYLYTIYKTPLNTVIALLERRWFGFSAFLKFEFWCHDNPNVNCAGIDIYIYIYI